MQVSKIEKDNLLDLIERINIQSAVFRTKKTTQRLSPEVKSYYNNTDILTAQIKKMLMENS